MRYAQVDSANMALVFLEGSPDDWPDLRDAGVLRPAPAFVASGWRWDGTDWLPPVPPVRVVPESVTNFQARAALMGAGMFEAVDSAIKLQGGMALQAWEYANTVSRNGPLVTAMAAGLGLSAEDLDSLFIQAEQIEA